MHYGSSTVCTDSKATLPHLLSTSQYEPTKEREGRGQTKSRCTAHRKRRKEHERNETLLAVPCHELDLFILTVIVLHPNCGSFAVLCFVLVIGANSHDQLCVLPVQTLSAQNLTIIYLQSGAK